MAELIFESLHEELEMAMIEYYLKFLQFNNIVYRLKIKTKSNSSSILYFLISRFITKRVSLEAL